jgi:hypothetical protein
MQPGKAGMKGKAGMRVAGMFGSIQSVMEAPSKRPAVLHIALVLCLVVSVSIGENSCAA